ncbi:MAG: pilus assembly protein PilM [Pirellulaceae bacterium]|nr:pilus assembly protein PilM [Pirellulaceae bacterium]
MLKTSDPYREWLGVEAAGEGPPNAYELLRLPLLEKDFHKIRQAGQRQRDRLERCKPAAEAGLWKQLQQQVEDAIHVLLEPSRKAELDLQLKRREATRRVAAPSAPAPRDATIEVTCGGCGQENTAGRRFCASCGGGLWVECLGCGEVGAVSEKYCGSCGANKDETIEQARAKCQAVIEQATALGQQFRFAEAVAVLSPLIQQTHQSLHQQVLCAAELMDQFVAQRREHKARAEAALARARELVDTTHYAEAVTLLESVPELFRGPEAVQVLRDARRKADEYGQLRLLLSEALKQKDAREALHLVERLLALNPDDADVDRVGRKLAQHVQQTASRHRARQDYQGCLQLLHEIPARYHWEQLPAQIHEVSELRWLQAELRRAPYANAVLQDVARRLTAADPGNEQAARLREQLEQRLARHASANAIPPRPVPWASLPAQSALGFPLEWLPGCQQIELPDPEVRQTYARHPGQFHVACGLALQGLGRAALPLDLKPRKKASVLGTLNISLTRKAATKSAWGIDLGTSALKAVRLSVTADERVVVDRCVWLPVNRQSDRHTGTLPATGTQTEALSQLRQAHPLEPNEPVCVNLPGLRLLGRFLRLPRLDGKRFQQILDHEVRHRVPVPLDELCWDHHVLPEHGEVHEEVPLAVLVVAAKQFEVERRLAHFQEAGIKVDFLQSDCIALHNWCQCERSASALPAESAGELPGTMLIDVGSDCTHVVVSWEQSFWFRVLAVGSDEVTRAVVKANRLTNEQAEAIKQAPHQAGSMSALFAAIDPVNERLGTQLKQSLAAFAQDYPEVRVRLGYGVGGGFCQHGLLSALYQSG